MKNRVCLSRISPAFPNYTGKINAKWNDLISGHESSALWKTIPESWGRESKYKEMTDYIEHILALVNQLIPDGGLKK